MTRPHQHRPLASHPRPVFVLLAALLSPPHVFAQEPIVGLPCEGCEAVFEGLPSAPPPTGMAGCGRGP